MTAISFDIGPFIEEERNQLLRKRVCRDHEAVVTAAMDAVRDRFRGRTFADIGALIRALAEVELMPAVTDIQDPRVADAVVASRFRIAAAVSRRLQEGQPVDIPRADPDGEMRWREGNGTRRQPRNEEQLRQYLDSFTKLVVPLGESALVDVLIARGLLEPSERLHALRILTRYFGECAPPQGHGVGGGILVAPPDILRHQSVYRVGHRILTKAVYDDLIARGGDSIGRRHELSLASAGTQAQRVLIDLARQERVPPEQHAWLFDEISTYYEQAAARRIPPHLRTSVPVRGEETLLDTWRMRLAIQELERQRHLYVGWDTGKQKTFLPVWFHELKKAERLRQGRPPGRVLFLSRSSIVAKLASRLDPSVVGGEHGALPYYLSDPPSVGLVRGGLKDAKLAEQLGQEYVFVADEMLHQPRRIQRGDEVVREEFYQRLLDCDDDPFTLLVIDEAHFFQGDGTWTGIARELIHGIPGLYEQGNILLLSATPASSLAGLRVQLELLEEPPPDMAEGGSRRRIGDGNSLDPRMMRNRAERLTIVDDPEPWDREYLHEWSFELPPTEMALQRMITRNNSYTHQEKLQLCLTAVRSPGMVTGNRSMGSSFEAWQQTLLREQLQRHDAIVVAEHHQSKGILHPGEEEDDPDFFFNRLRADCAEWAQSQGRELRFHVVHGDVRDMSRRDDAYRDINEAGRTGAFKAVLLGQSGCFDHGINLEGIGCVVCNEPAWTFDKLRQLLGRSRSARTHIYVMYATGTVEEGIFFYARNKYRDTKACLYGDRTIDDAHLRRAMASTEDVDVESPEVSRFLDSPEQHLRRLQRFLHNAGAHGCYEFWEQNRSDYQLLLDSAETSANGDRHRLLASLIEELERARILTPGRFLFTNSEGGAVHRMLCASGSGEGRQSIVLDPVHFMLDRGLNRLRPEDPVPTAIEGTPAHLIGLMREGRIERASLDGVFLDGLEQMHMHAPEDGSLHFTERVEAIIGAVRALRTDGTLVITLPREACTRREFDAFVQQLPHFGLRVLNAWSGQAQSTDNEGDAPFQEFVVVATKTLNTEEIADESYRTTVQALVDPSALRFTHIEHWQEQSDRASRTRIENERRRRRLPYALLHSQFRVGHHACGNSLGSELRTTQLQHLADMQSAVERVRHLAQSPEEFLAQADAFRQELMSQGVEYWPYLSVRSRLAFRLTAYPEHIFFPYDEQWNPPGVGSDEH